jgi:hypothetical protein
MIKPVALCGKDLLVITCKAIRPAWQCKPLNRRRIIIINGSTRAGLCRKGSSHETCYAVFFLIHVPAPRLPTGDETACLK